VNSNMKMQDNEINEAKESLKLLKLKVNNNLAQSKFNGVTNTLNNGMNLNNNPNQSNPSQNYRKAFKPNLGIGSDINTNSNMSTKDEFTNKMPYNQGKTTFSGNSSNNKFNYNSNKIAENKYSGSISKNNLNPNFHHQPISKNKNSTKSKVQYEEVDDDRPAFSNGEKNTPSDFETNTGDLIECNSCGRKFNKLSIQKHQKNCKKVFQSKRKTFDTKKKRIIDSEHAMILRHAEAEEKSKSKFKAEAKIKKKEKWKKAKRRIKKCCKTK